MGLLFQLLWLPGQVESLSETRGFRACGGLTGRTARVLRWLEVALALILFT